LRAAHGAGLHEGLVIAGIEFELAVLQMQDELRHAVEQVTIMADDDDGAAIAFQIILKPQHTFEIEIVRRLVEQQQVRCPE
jgi:hypothetical protein